MHLASALGEYLNNYAPTESRISIGPKGGKNKGGSNFSTLSISAKNNYSREERPRYNDLLPGNVLHSLPTVKVSRNGLQKSVSTKRKIPVNKLTVHNSMQTFERNKKSAQQKQVPLEPINYLDIDPSIFIQLNSYSI